MRISPTSFFDFLKRIVQSFLYRVQSLWAASTTTLPYLFGKGDLVKEITEQYPDPVSSRTVDDLPPRTRGLLQNDMHKCTGCGKCQKICPVGCIQIETEEGVFPEDKWVSVFDIDFSKCVFCSLCVDVCEPVSLTHSAKFEAAEADTRDLIFHYGRGGISGEQKKKWEEIRKSKREESGRLF